MAKRNKPPESNPTTAQELLESWRNGNKGDVAANLERIGKASIPHLCAVVAYMMAYSDTVHKAGGMSEAEQLAHSLDVRTY